MYFTIELHFFFSSSKCKVARPSVVDIGGKQGQNQNGVLGVGKIKGQVCGCDGVRGARAWALQACYLLAM